MKDQVSDQARLDRIRNDMDVSSARFRKQIDDDVTERLMPIHTKLYRWFTSWLIKRN